MYYYRLSSGANKCHSILHQLNIFSSMELLNKL
jgi:hypothetical protein